MCFLWVWTIAMEGLSRGPVQNDKQLEKLTSIEVGLTALAWPMSLTYDLDLRSPVTVSYGHDLLTCKSSKSVSSEVETNGQTDGGECITSHVNAVGN